MPDIRLHVPLLLIRGRHPLVIAQPLMFPELGLAAENARTATTRVGKSVRRLTEKQLSPLELATRRGHPAETLRHIVELTPPPGDLAWKQPLACLFESIRWQPGGDLVAYYIHALDLTILVGRRDDAAAIIDAQIRAELLRQGIRSLAQLAQLDYATRHSCRIWNRHLRARLLTPREQQRQQDSQTAKTTVTLRRVATRLHRKDLQPAYHCRRSLSRLAECLAEPARRSALLVGPSGVGKTAIVHQLVRTAKSHALKHPFWATEGTRLVSGQCGFGMWQEQALQMAKEAQASDAIMHLGNLFELSEAGRIDSGGGIGSFLAGRIAEASLLAIAECTAEQLQLLQRRDPKLAAAFEIIHVSPPFAEETRAILTAAAQHPEPVPLEPDAIEWLDHLHRRFPTDAAAPGRQLRFLQQVRSELAVDEGLTRAAVTRAFISQTGLPAFLIDPQQRPDLSAISRQLSQQVIGQSHATECLLDLVSTLVMGFSRGDRPLASLLLTGPTGVGKTESAKALARLIYSDESRLVRIDMSELSSPTAVARLIGDYAKPEGLLTGTIRAQPFSLLLLDEFEKAHPAVFDLLLQVLGEGRLTDSQGRVADFRNCILMMTSNLGADSFQAVSMGLAATDDALRYRRHFENEVRRFLRPEMFNRLDRVIPYDPLSPTTIRQIAQSHLETISRRDGLKSRDGKLQWDEATLDWLADRGYQPELGARPLARLIEYHLVTPLAEALCSLPPDCGVLARVEPRGNRLHVDVERRDHWPRRGDPNDAPQARLKVVEQWVALRRNGQAMLRSPAFLQLTNRRTQLRRMLRRKLQAATKRTTRQRIRASASMAMLRTYEERIQKIDSIVNDLIEAETQAVWSYHQSAWLDVAAETVKVKEFRERMWDGLATLLADEALEDQRLAIRVTGPNLKPFAPLLETYRQIAQHHDWSFEAYAMLPKELIPPITSEEMYGWQELSTCSLSATSSPSGDASASQNRSASQPLVDLHRLALPAALTEPPRGTVGYAINIRGRAAKLMLEAEAGLHSFCRDGRRSQAHDDVILMETQGGQVTDLQVPGEIHRRQFPIDGYPRRRYQFEQQRIHDMALNQIELWDDDNSFDQLLTHLVAKEAQRRVWSQIS